MIFFALFMDKQKKPYNRNAAGTDDKEESRHPIFSRNDPKTRFYVLTSDNIRLTTLDKHVSELR